MTKEQEFRKQTEEAKLEAFSLMCKKVTELKKENKDLHDNYEQYKAVSEPEIDALKNEIINLKGVIESLSEQRDRLEKENGKLVEAKKIIKDYVDRDDSCWSIKKRAEEFLKECQ